MGSRVMEGTRALSSKREIHWEVSRAILLFSTDVPDETICFTCCYTTGS